MNILESIVKKKRERLSHGIVEGEPLAARFTPKELLKLFREAGQSQVTGRRSQVAGQTEPRASASGPSKSKVKGRKSKVEGQPVHRSTGPQVSKSAGLDLRPSTCDLRLPLIIAELKKASPSKGVIREAYDPVETARQYQEAGAFAISVLTEEDFFQGSLQHLRAVREAVPLPLLRKDFIVAPEQLRESRIHGADMVLLIVACLQDRQLQELICSAKKEELLPLVEVHDEQEADRAVHAGAELLGINNRSLRSFEVDLGTGIRLGRYIREKYGDKVAIVAESGIYSARDMQLLSEAGCHAFLIGESLLRAEKPGDALRALLDDYRDLQVESRKSQVAGQTEPRASASGPSQSKVEGRRSKVEGQQVSKSAGQQVSKSTGPDNERSTCDLRLATCDLRPSIHYPDASGHYGPYGGKFVPETLMAPLEELEAAYLRCSSDPEFQKELQTLLAEYVGRPTPLTFAARLSSDLANRTYFKREDLCHTGAHKINNALGQALLAKRMGKQRIVAETGAGQHGVAAATVCALLGLQCCVYMGVEDMARQELNVFRMKLLGAEVVPVTSGTQTLKDAINETMRDWVTNVHDTHYLLGSVLGPHPYPQMVRDFQRVIGREARAQVLEREGRLPDFLIACVGGGSNSIGLFFEFLGDAEVAMVGVEAGGRSPRLGDHAARFLGGNPGVLHGCHTYVLQDPDGQIAATHSVSAGLDYAAIGPEHAWMHDQGRIEFTSADDAEALHACRVLSQKEGLIPALESAHAVAELLRNRDKYRNKLVIINLSGRGDKDMPTLQKEIEKWSKVAGRKSKVKSKRSKRFPQAKAAFQSSSF